MIKSSFKELVKLSTGNFKIQQSFLDLFYRQYEASVFKNLISDGKETVMAGPFKGLKIKAQFSNRNFRTVHLLGMFETCLHDELLRLTDKHDTFVNIGCGSGYYTNGLAHHIRQKDKAYSSIKGYDISEDQIAVANTIKEYNTLHNVEHFCVSRNYNYDFLKGKKALAIIDIEGGEYPLLDEQRDNFLECDLLIEIHSTQKMSIDDGLNFLIDLYQDTHNVKIINESKTIDLTLLNDVKKSFGHIGYIGMHLLCCENRSYPMKWLLLENKNTSN